MKISFEKYGNLYRWREIYESNKDKIGNYNMLTAGTILTIEGVEYVVIEKNGKPYLIRRSDTLTKIAGSLYGAPTQWRLLWENNKQLIHDPNKIYAGFTLYYQPLGGENLSRAEPPLNERTGPSKNPGHSRQKGPSRGRLPASR
jgi:hypothetical protein